MRITQVVRSHAKKGMNRQSEGMKLTGPLRKYRSNRMAFSFKRTNLQFRLRRLFLRPPNITGIQVSFALGFRRSHTRKTRNLKDLLSWQAACVGW